MFQGAGFGQERTGEGHYRALSKKGAHMYMADEGVAPKLLKRSELGRVLSKVIMMYTRMSPCLLLTCGSVISQLTALSLPGVSGPW